MHRIMDLDRQLSNMFLDFKEIAKALKMNDIFDLADEKTIALQSYPGIYRIDVSTAASLVDLPTWIKEFRLEWEHSDFLKKFTPNFKLKRIAQHHHLREWMPLYLGKSKNVGKRVLEHINLELNKPTFALKLKARPTMEKRIFRLHTMKLPVQNYDLLVPTLESALRDEFHPLIGKQ